MIKRVKQSFDLLFALLNLAIKLVTVSLQLFLLLGGLDDVVGLGVLTLRLDLA